jgi:acyl transferase domain-containing protein
VDVTRVIFPLSAATPTDLRALAGATAYALRTTNAPLESWRSDVAHDALHLPERLAVLLPPDATPVWLAERLNLVAQGVCPPDVLMGRATVACDVIFVFPGQGAVWAGVGPLLTGSSIVRDALIAADQALQPHLDWSPMAVFAAPPVAPLPVDRMHPLLFALQVGLAALWRSWGVEPAAVAGYGLGEIAAAHVAGILSLDDAARVICRRRYHLRQAPPGAMLLTGLSAHAARTQTLLDVDVTIAAFQSPHTTVLAGTPNGIAAVERELHARGVA